MNEIVLKPYYVAFVSGGKDSLYMLQVILNNLHKYPLNCVCHFELEIDFPFVKNVIALMKEMCEKIGVKFITFKPRTSWFELVEKYNMPTRLARWCNSKYKLDCQKQLDEYLNSIGCYCVKYIGFCADENKRFKYKVGSFDYKNDLLCYPLAEENIEEHTILEWARNVAVFNDYYKFINRCGCMMCPCSSLMGFAYVKILPRRMGEI